MTIIYTRTLLFAAAHFNGAEQYERLEEAYVAKPPPSADEWLAIFAGTHGHDFSVEVTLEGDGDEDGLILSDEDIEREIIGTYANKHLSLIPRLSGKRATTEVLAESMAWDIAKLCRSGTQVRVRVWEDQFRWAEKTRSAV